MALCDRINPESPKSWGELRRIAFEGSAEEWASLHAKCERLEFAKAFLKLLTKGPERKDGRADQWIALLKEMHPGVEMSPTLSAVQQGWAKIKSMAALAHPDYLARTLWALLGATATPLFRLSSRRHRDDSRILRQVH